MLTLKIISGSLKNPSPVKLKSSAGLFVSPVEPINGAKKMAPSLFVKLKQSPYHYRAKQNFYANAIHIIFFNSVFIVTPHVFCRISKV